MNKKSEIQDNSIKKNITEKPKSTLKKSSKKNIMPKVSVVVPCYNVEKYLRQALDCLINQTLQDIEIICINDGSPDNSLAILREYEEKDFRVVVVDNPNGGVGKAINTGLDLARGEYVAHMDSDDYFSVNMLEDLYYYASKNNLDLCISNFCRFSGQFETYKQVDYRFHQNPYFYNRVFSPEDFLIEDNNYLIGFGWCQTWSTLYRTEFLNKHKIRWNEDVRAYNDLGFWFQTRTLCERLMYIDKIYYFYRQDNVTSTINNLNEMFPMRQQESFFVRRKLEEHGIYDKFRDFYFLSKVKAYLYFVLPRIDFQFKPVFIEMIADELIPCLEKGELRELPFNQTDWNSIVGICLNPNLWYEKYLKENYKVSVILPIGDNRTEIHKILDSILNQKMSNLELVCVDTGSTDGTVDIIQNYANYDKRIVFIRLEQPKAEILSEISQSEYDKIKLTYADYLNIGIENAHSTYVYIQNFNNILNSYTLNDAFQTADTHNADICIFRCEDVYMKNGFREFQPTAERRVLFPKMPFCITDFKCDPFEVIDGFVDNKLFRRQFLIDNKIKFVAPKENSEKDIKIALAAFVINAVLKAETMSLDERDCVLRYIDDTAEDITDGVVSDTVAVAFQRLRRVKFGDDLSEAMSVALTALSESPVLKNEKIKTFVEKWVKKSPKVLETNTNAQGQITIINANERSNYTIFSYGKNEEVDLNANTCVELFEFKLPETQWFQLIAVVDFVSIGNNTASYGDTLFISCSNKKDLVVLVNKIEWANGNFPFAKQLGYITDGTTIKFILKYTGWETGISYTVRSMSSRQNMLAEFKDLITTPRINNKKIVPQNFVTVKNTQKLSDLTGRIKFGCVPPSADTDNYVIPLFSITLFEDNRCNFQAIIDFMIIKCATPFTDNAYKLAAFYEKTNDNTGIEVYQSEWQEDDEEFDDNIFFQTDKNVLTIYSRSFPLNTGLAWSFRMLTSCDQRLPEVKILINPDNITINNFLRIEEN